MLEWCETAFELGKRLDDGTTLRDNLEAAERNTGRSHPLLQKASEAPSAIMYLVDIFNDLSLTRQWSMNGPCAVGFDQIYFWQLANGFPLRHWERKALLKVDDLWRRMSAQSKHGAVE